jgi:hypothetical protein
LGVKENVKDPQPPGEAVVVRDPKRPYHIRIPIPDAIVSLLYRQLGTERSEPLTYLLVSDTDQRLLRAFFPTPATARHLVHLGFYHNDTPGALSAMMQALAGAEFNIVAGLLRKQDRLRSVWEVVLEYKGTSTMPDQGSGEELCTWVAKTLAELADNHHELHRCEIKVGLPLYPRSSWSGQIALNSYLRNDPARIRQDQKQLLNEALATAKARSRDDDERPRAIELLETVGRRMEGPVKPTLFLSYPFSASRHAGLVAKKLGDRYEIVDYRDPNGMIEYKEGQSDAIVQTVAKLIVACDCFLGIWHHDETMPTEDGKFGISPWLPFEYGLAVAANKPTVVIHSEKLDKDVWGRIDPGIKNPEYSDILFQDTLDMLDRYFKGR